MSFHDRFLAHQTPANPAGLQLLFDDLNQLSGPALTAAVRDYHPSLSAATAEIAPADGLGTHSGPGPAPHLCGLVTFGPHVVKLIGFAAPMPVEVSEVCLRPALLPSGLKAEARRHEAHVLLYYAGTATVPLEQLVAVGVVAGALARLGAMVTLNEEARTAVASTALLPDDDGEDMLETLRGLPVPFLWGGFVKLELSGTPGVWVRTYACRRLGLPNLACRVADHDACEGVFKLYTAILGYLRETGLTFEPGEQIRIDDKTHYRVREPILMEWWLDSDGPLWVLENVEVPDDALSGGGRGPRSGRPS